jgi:hypothetical protein
MAIYAHTHTGGFGVCKCVPTCQDEFMRKRDAIYRATKC